MVRKELGEAHARGAGCAGISARQTWQRRIVAYTARLSLRLASMAMDGVRGAALTPSSAPLWRP